MICIETLIRIRTQNYSVVFDCLMPHQNMKFALTLLTIITSDFRFINGNNQYSKENPPPCYKIISINDPISRLNGCYCSTVTKSTNSKRPQASYPIYYKKLSTSQKLSNIKLISQNALNGGWMIYGFKGLNTQYRQQ